MRTFVTFESDFPHDGTSCNPPGLELAQYLYEGIQNAGFRVSNIENREDWAWDFILNRKNYQIETIIGYVDDLPVQWLITTHLHLSFWKSLFLSRYKAHAEKDMQYYCHTIHKLLSDGRFRSVRWYEQKDFDLNAYDKWASSP